MRDSAREQTRGGCTLRTNLQTSFERYLTLECAEQVPGRRELCNLTDGRIYLDNVTLGRVNRPRF